MEEDNESRPLSPDSADRKPGAEKDKKRRAFKACAHCRQRKAKCDLGDLNHPKDPPCARCKREGIPCTFLPSRRGGRVPFAARQNKAEFELNAQDTDRSLLSEDPTNAFEGYQPKREGSHPAFSSDSLAGTSSIGQISPSVPPSALQGGNSSYPPPKLLPPLPPLSEHPTQSNPIFQHRSLNASEQPTYVHPSGQTWSGLPLPSAESQNGHALAADSALLHSRTTPGQASQRDHSYPYSTFARSPASEATSPRLPIPHRRQSHPMPPPGSHPFQYPSSKAMLPGGSTSSATPGSAGSAAIPLPHVTSVPSGISPSGESQSSLESSSRKHRKHEDNRIIDPDTLAAAKLRNPVDALNLLVLAADHRDPKTGKPKDGTSPQGNATEHDGDASHTREVDDPAHTSRLRSVSTASATPPPFTLADFALVKRGICSIMELNYFVHLFFNKIHYIFPIVPHTRVPQTEAQLTIFARDEIHLTTAFVLIASRLDQGSGRNLEIHDKTWEFMRELISDLVFGKDASVGAVEALLLLSEHPPRTLAGSGRLSEDYADENRMSWMLVGNAIRIGYMLALDQTTLTPPIADSAAEGDSDASADRERICWVYCYLFDRQISIRTGKAFWSRGPGLAFTGSSAASFPTMRAIPGVQDDYASFIQAFVEITQTMTNAHDILYPSRDRTIALVRVGEYYKHIESFTRTLNSFRFTWEGKQWATFPLTECVWITFHYLRLYIYAFAFQAHLQRAETANAGSKIFPKGMMGSPDAKFIVEAVDAAADLLRICTDRLHPQGVLQFLPWRYFLYFAYAGVFLLKAVFLQAVAPTDRRVIVKLLKRLIICLACASKDEHHHAVRYARLLNSLLRTFSRGQDGVGTALGTPAARRSPPPASPTQGDTAWPVSRAGSPQPGAYTGRKGFNPPDFGKLRSGSSTIPTPGNQQPPSMSMFTDTIGANTAQEEQAAADLLSQFDLDFGLPQTEQTAPFDAYSNLLDDTTMSFWAALSNNAGGDWNMGNSG